MALFKYLEENKKAIHLHLDQNLAITQFPNTPYLHESIKRIVNFMQEGKMLRSALVTLSYNFLSKTSNPRILNAALSIELIHSSFLIHDDIMDNDILRRGQKTVFAQYKDYALSKKLTMDPLFYGQGMAICVGNIASILAFKLLSQSSTKESVLENVFDIFTREVARVNGAQMLDFHYGGLKQKDEPTPEEIIEMYRNKAARYTFSLPLVMGGLLAKADSATITSLDTMGENLGIVFQIKDDEIELYSLEAEIGKPVGSDIRENKKTFIRSLLYSLANTHEKTTLSTIYGNQKLTTKQIEYVKGLIEKYNVRQTLVKKMENLSVKALRILDKTNGNTTCKNTLKELIEYNVSRTK